MRAVGAQLTASLRPLAAILAVVVLRNVTFLGFNLFIAILNRDRGMGLAAGGIALSVYSLAGVLASLGVGRVADRTDPKPLVWGSLAAAAPFLCAYALVPGPASLLLLAVGGGLLGSSTSVMVALAQQAAPGQRALASSLPLGMSWGLASLTLPLLGWFADLAGVTVMLTALGWLPLIAAAIAFRFLPRNRP